MIWKEKLRSGGLLYVILDEETIKKAKLDIFSLAENLSKWGVDFFQFRFKDICDRVACKIATELRKIIHKRKKVFLINNRVDISYLSGADGVHLGNKDLSCREARKILGKKVIVGKTVHNLRELMLFEKEKVDYISVGPIFETALKSSLVPLKDKIRQFIKRAKKPLFVIGGIDLKNVKSLLKMGIKNIVVCRGVILSKDIKSTVLKLKQCLEKVC
ncbi:MAG TPA: thiamine phosphate synthase [Candidatus Omnitrophica bacterium]|nr:thiamine phosphate synthase [Candidatus Omnitrophota bacterium]